MGNVLDIIRWYQAMQWYECFCTCGILMSIWSVWRQDREMSNSSASKCKESKCNESRCSSPTSAAVSEFGDPFADGCVIVDVVELEVGILLAEFSGVTMPSEDRSKLLDAGNEGSDGDRNSSVGVASASDELSVGHGENWMERESGDIGVGMGYGAGTGRAADGSSEGTEDGVNIRFRLSMERRRLKERLMDSVGETERAGSSGATRRGEEPSSSTEDDVPEPEAPEEPAVEELGDG